MLFTLAPSLQQKEVSGRSPEDRASPVADKGEDADGDDVEATNAIVGAGEIDGGDGVRAAISEEGGELKEDGGYSNLGD